MWWGLIIFTIGLIFLRLQTKWNKLIVVQNDTRSISISKRGLLKAYFKVEQNINKEEPKIKIFDDFLGTLQHCERCLKDTPEVFIHLMLKFIIGEPK